MKAVKFGDLFEFIRNGMSVKQDKSGAGLPVSRIETIWNSSIDPQRVGFAGLEEGDCRHWLLSRGDILFSHINSVEHIGKCAVYEGTPEKLVHGMNLLCLRCKKDALAPEYAKHLIRSPGFREQLSSFINKAVNQASISIGNLKGIEVRVPPLAEQRRIAAILDKADALRTKRREALAQLDRLAQSIFVEMFGDPIENPRNFPVSPLINLIDERRPITYGILMPGRDVEDGIPYVRVVDMKNGGIEFSGIRKTSHEISNVYRRSLLRVGDILMSIRGHVGRFAIIPPQLDGANITQDSARLAVAGANPFYVRECLKSTGFQRWMAKHTKGVAVRGINLGDVKIMPIPLPESRLQDDFAERAIAIEAMQREFRESLSFGDKLFSSIQHRAFRGQL